MPRELIQARADPDTIERVEAYAEERDISRSEAIRRLLREGLDSKAEASAVERLSNREDLSEAHMSDRVRLIGGALLALAIAFVLLQALGVV